MTFQMPRPRVGDLVQWSSDVHHFSSPSIGWIMAEPGATTVNILTFSQGVGFAERLGVHHKDDPAIKDNPGWQESGCWALTPQQATINKIDGIASQMTVFMAKAETRNAKATTG